jgi:hypothetical protein
VRPLVDHESLTIVQNLGSVTWFWTHGRHVAPHVCDANCSILAVEEIATLVAFTDAHRVLAGPRHGFQGSAMGE